MGEFACSALRGISQVLPHGQYEATLSLLDEQKRPVSEITGGPFNIHRHGLTELPLDRVPGPGLGAGLGAGRRHGGGTRPAPPAREAGVRTVELETQLASEPREKYTFPCEDGDGITQAIRTGIYAYQLRLLDAGGQVAHETNVMSYEVPDGPPGLIWTPSSSSS